MHSSASTEKRSGRLMAGHYWIALTLLVLTSFSTLAALAESDELQSTLFTYFPELPKGVSPERWTGLRTAVEQAKLLPPSEGIGGEDGQFGYSVSLSGNRALIGGIGLGEFRSGGAVIFVNTAGTWVKEASLVPADGEQLDLFGISVSLDGDRALVGSPGDDDNGRDSGSVYVFEFNGTSWVEMAKLLPADGEEFDRFGSAVSLEGGRALVGSPEDDDDFIGRDSGSAYVFELDGMIWAEVAKILPADGEFVDRFGSAVSLSSDRVLIGVPNDRDNGNQSGSAYIFDFNGTSWVETTKLLPADGVDFDDFGLSVSLSGDRALVGMPRDGDNGNVSGSAYVFDFNGINWTETTKLLPADGAEFDQFGWSVSLSGDRVLVGARRSDGNGPESGSAYVFDFDGIAWSETAKLTASDGELRDEFGFSVSLSGDQALIGAPFDDDGVEDTGSAYVFEFNGVTWAETTQLLPGDGAFGDAFGLSISLFGGRALVGVPGDDDNGTRSGSAYVFDYNGTIWTETAKLLPSDGAQFRDFGESVSLFGDRALIGGGARSAYVFDFNGTTWTETFKLLPALGSFRDDFGNSVSLFGNRALVGAPGDEDNGFRSGAAYVFDFNGTMWSETAKLLPTDGTSRDSFGSSVSLFSDRALIGASFNDDFGSSSGSAYVFDFIGAEWRETSKLLPVDGVEFGYFGRSVSLFGDRALVGAPGNDNNGSSSGAAYVFEFEGFDWIEIAKLLPSDGAEFDDFGESVSLFGNRALVGMPRDDDNGDASGSAYVFDLIGATWRETVKLLPTDGAEFDQFGVSASLFANRVLIAAPFDDDSGAESGSAYVFDLLQIFQDDFESEL